MILFPSWQQNTLFAVSGFTLLALGFLMLTSQRCQALELGNFSSSYDQEELEISETLKKNLSLPGNNLQSPTSMYLGETYYRSGGFSDYKFNKDLRVRGWEIGSKVYFGHTTLVGDWGFGIVVDKDDYVFGINSNSVSIMKRF